MTQPPEWALSLRAELRELRRELADVQAHNVRLLAEQARAQAAQRLFAADLRAQLDARMASFERTISLFISDRCGDEGMPTRQFES